ncbi:hypothetical protein BS47DRAFT_1369348 [Hydnum rufescens UP504]|uniref:Uncharacterized protein n=1 Tax=Hydnum rufescens UP504 TaxID=1448309 RepID=A0A9P6AEE5_9AGAM|nr:hypothetical protein BS47DRAFT_1369348 [Hydnum rufescens UP504]
MASQSKAPVPKLPAMPRNIAPASERYGHYVHTINTVLTQDNGQPPIPITPLSSSYHPPSTPAHATSIAVALNRLELCCVNNLLTLSCLSNDLEVIRAKRIIYTASKKALGKSGGISTTTCQQTPFYQSLSKLRKTGHKSTQQQRTAPGQATTPQYRLGCGDKGPPSPPLCMETLPPATPSSSPPVVWDEWLKQCQPEGQCCLPISQDQGKEGPPCNTGSWWHRYKPGYKSGTPKPIHTKPEINKSTIQQKTKENQANICTKNGLLEGLGTWGMQKLGVGGPEEGGGGPGQI